MLKNIIASQETSRFTDFQLYFIIDCIEDLKEDTDVSKQFLKSEEFEQLEDMQIQLEKEVNERGYSLVSLNESVIDIYK